jgi:hypothetical protein
MKTTINLSANLTGLTFPVNPVAFDNEVIDTAGAFSAGSPGHIIAPSGVTMVRLEAAVRVPDSGTTGTLLPSIYKNGAETICGTDVRRNNSAGYSNNVAFTSAPWQPCSPGDDFTVRCNVTGLGSPTSVLSGNNSYFSAEFA